MAVRLTVSFGILWFAAALAPRAVVAQAEHVEQGEAERESSGSEAAPVRAEPAVVPAVPSAPDVEAATASEDATPIWLRPSEGGLTVEQVTQMALDTAPSVRRARAAQSAASAGADEAVSAFAPRFEFTGSYSRINMVDLPPFEIPGLPPSDNPFPQILDLFSIQGTVTIPVSDYFLTILPGYEGAQGLARASEYQTEVERQQTAFRAREAFFNYIRARGAQWVAGEAVTSIEATLRDVETMYQNEAGSRADVAQVRAQLASARAAVVQARGQVRIAARSLRQILHVDRAAPIEIGENIFAVEVSPPPTEDEVMQLAMERRPDVRALRQVVDARQAIVRSRVGSTLPRIALSGQIETSSPNQRVIPQTSDIYTTWRLSAIVSWSPNDLATGVHRVRAAEAELAQAEEDLEQIRDGIAVEAAQVVAALTTASENIGAAREQVGAADLALTDRRAMLRAGAATTTEVSNAQLELTRAQLNLINAYVDYQVAGATRARVEAEDL